MTDTPRDPSDMSHPLYDATRDPSHPFYEGNKTEGDPKPVASDDEHRDKVGPGSPPKQYTWKRGCRSPNPNGRPKKNPSMRPDLKKAFEAALNETVVITKDKKKVTLTMAILGIQQLVHQFAKGDRHARRDVFQYAALLGVDLQAGDVITEALGINHQGIVDAAIRRHQQQLPAEAITHVKAPPDLGDDDVTTPDPSAAPSAFPQSGSPVKKPVAPEGDSKPPHISSIEYIRAERDRNLAQQRKNQGLS